MSMHLRKRWSANLTLALMGCALALLIIEGGLRTLRPPFVVGISHFPCIYQVDDKLGYRYIPGAAGLIHRNFEIDNPVQINSTGFHDVEHRTVSNNQLRILAIGDSFTAGLEVRPSAGWTQVLQRELNRNGYHSAEVVNLGIDGTGTDVHLAVLRQYAPTVRPHIVILAFHNTDIDDSIRGRIMRECFKGYVLTFQTDEQQTELRVLADNLKSRSVSRWLFENVYLYRAIMFIGGGKDNPLRTNFLKPSHIGVEVASTENSEATIEVILQGFVDLSREYEFDFLTIPIPAKRELGGLDVLRSGISEKQFTAMNVFDVSSIIETQLEKEEKKYQDMYWLYDGHFNAYGNRIFGLAVAKSLDSYLKNSLLDS